MTSTWRLQQLTRVIQDAVKRSGGIWDDEASRYVKQRYIRPHEGLANDQCTAALEQIDAADLVAEQCAEATEMQSRATLQLEAAGELALSSDNEMKSGFEFIHAGTSLAAQANTTIDQAFAELGKAGSACGDAIGTESLMSRVRTKEDQHEARAQALVGVVAGLSSQVADQLIGDQAGGPVEQLINTLGNSGIPVCRPGSSRRSMEGGALAPQGAAQMTNRRALAQRAVELLRDALVTPDDSRKISPSASDLPQATLPDLLEGFILLIEDALASTTPQVLASRIGAIEAPSVGVLVPEPDSRRAIRLRDPEFLVEQINEHGLDEIVTLLSFTALALRLLADPAQADGPMAPTNIPYQEQGNSNGAT